ncbi:RedY [Serratia rubidaea]|uniref:RedY n=1 Tax=Serratia rubidaea TaxID=61652 RepID=A0A3S4YMN3_SERRU|nr:RedY [Serratia rubidaea]MBH1931595.1 RedY [Serratia rubidaea]MDC6116947.1 RedY [Serratia rubidaea]MDK1706281.1 RedY [Serratia rubidaea]MEB7587594.1 RedY [Serratia rubidaea]VEI64200.1 REDY-like protein HapK [Serratia rubidaea]
MHTIVHKIRLKDIAQRAAFREWVETVDYPACCRLDAVHAFEVVEVSREADAPFHFIEIIHISAMDAFEREMRTPLFQSLVTRFDQMAEVVTEIAGERIGDGYQQQ